MTLPLFRPLLWDLLSFVTKLTGTSGGRKRRGALLVFQLDMTKVVCLKTEKQILFGILFRHLLTTICRVRTYFDVLSYLSGH